MNILSPTLILALMFYNDRFGINELTKIDMPLNKRNQTYVTWV